MSRPSALLWTVVTTAGIWAAAGNHGRAENVFSSNLPLLVIDAHGQSITNNVHVPADIIVIGVKDGQSTLAGPVEHAGKASVWLRGFSSQMHPKKPYRVELQDEKGDDLKVPLLGMPRESDWILNATYTDKTMVRDVMAQDLWRQMGHTAMRTRYVEVFVVSTNEVGKAPSSKASDAQPVETITRYRSPGGKLLEYQGVYILMEKIKRGKDRLNIAKLTGKEDQAPKITGGYIFKKDRINRGEKGFKSSEGVQFAFEEPKEKEITPAQAQYLTNYVNEFERVLFSDNFRDPTNGYRRYIDVDSFVDYHWLLELSRNIDGYWFSQFFYKDRNGKLNAGPAWDFDLSFGNSFYEDGYKTNGWRWGAIQGKHYRWYDRLFEDPDFLQRYIDRWTELRTNVFATSNMLARIDSYTNQIHQAQARNYERWGNLGKFVHPNKFIGKTYEEEVAWLKKWITDRLCWIDSQGFPAPVAKRESGGVVSLAAPVGKIFYTLGGSDPRAASGMVAPKAGEYTAPITLAGAGRLCARVRSEHGLWSPPTFLTN